MIMAYKVTEQGNIDTSAPQCVKMKKEVKKLPKIKPEQYKKLQREAAARGTTVHALLTDTVYAVKLTR